ncbi:hypothetical protein FACS1894217_00820 [Clostridia bacterium]|nr:hypothetical protein FACS1894217_00820 [Clostridia bacterium]
MLNDDRAAIFAANPYPVLVFDEQLSLLDANPAGVKVTGASSLDDIRGMLYAPLLAAVIPKLQPDGRPSMSWGERVKYMEKAGRDRFETWLMRDGELRPVDVTIRRMTYSGVPAIALFVCETYDVARVERTLTYLQTMLNAVDQCVRLLVDLDADNVDEIVRLAMVTLSTSINADRATVYCIDSDDDNIFNLRYLISNIPGDDPNARPLLTRVNFASDLPNWQAIIARGECVNLTLSAMSPAERAAMGPLGVKAILLMPIKFKGRLWGGVVLESCFRERTFTSSEIAIMRSGAALVAFCLSRLDIMDNLKTAQEAALKSSSAKSFFLANMSHEIRTPINAVIGMAAIAQSTDDAAYKERCLQKICDASAHLLGIINDILDMSKIEADKMELSYADFNFEKMLRKAVNIVNFRVSEKNQELLINIDDSVPADLVGDDQRLAQVVTNLLSNAVKFTPGGGRIRLTASLEEQQEDIFYVKIAVTDTGIGISAEQQSVLFNSFQQAENSTSRNFGGTGLGLSISKRIVELMNGRIWVESALAEGSSFMFVVPMKRGAPLETEVSDGLPDGKPDFTGYRIMLAEDNEINREIVLTLLGPTGITVDCAENGEEAVKLYNANPGKYQMIFMDLQMPFMDGYEATRLIREAGGDVPIVAMTANVFREDVEQCLKAGMNDHVGKPLDFDEVLIKLRKNLFSGGGAINRV